LVPLWRIIWQFLVKLRMFVLQPRKSTVRFFSLEKFFRLSIRKHGPRFLLYRYFICMNKHKVV
jgi:hypothetical protein